MKTRAPSESLVLIDARPEHAEHWLNWRNQAQSRRFNPLSDLPVSELSARLAQVGHDPSLAGCEEYRWMVQLDDVVVGTVSLSEVSWSCRYGSLGIMLDAAYHRRGLGRASLRLLVNKIFERSVLDRVWATVSVDNVASRRLFDTSGFTHEGTMREHFVIEGRPVDQCIYALLRREWQHGASESPSPDK